MARYNQDDNPADPSQDPNRQRQALLAMMQSNPNAPPQTPAYTPPPTTPAPTNSYNSPAQPQKAPAYVPSPGGAPGQVSPTTPGQTINMTPGAVQNVDPAATAAGNASRVAMGLPALPGPTTQANDPRYATSVNLPGFDPSRTDSDPKQVFGTWAQGITNGTGVGLTADEVRQFVASHPEWEINPASSANDPQIRVKQDALNGWKPGTSTWQDVIGDAGGTGRVQFMNAYGDPSQGYAGQAPASASQAPPSAAAATGVPGAASGATPGTLGANTNDPFTEQVRQAVLAMMGINPADTSSYTGYINNQMAPIIQDLERARSQRQASAAERLGAMGLGSSGAMDAETASSFDDMGSATAKVRAGLMQNLESQLANQKLASLGIGSSLAGTLDQQTIQKYIADLQNGQAGNTLGYDYTYLQYLANKDAATYPGSGQGF